MFGERVLLVCIGVLGDLSWRKFMVHARDLEQRERDVEVLLIDVPWNISHAVSREQELRWRIGRRCIELLAEKIDRGEVADLRLTVGLADKPLPWEVEDFFEHCVDGSSASLALEKEKVTKFICEQVRYATSTSLVTGLPKYAFDLAEVGSTITRMKEWGWRVVLFIATPPQAYPELINRWKYLADRIVLEKPACGLNPQTLLFDGDGELLRTVNGVPATTQVVTNDHYNAKSIVRMLDRIHDYGIFESLLKPEKIKRIVVQLLEAAPLPLGRCGFYVGSGGAFGDMVPHLLQAVRASLGLTPGDFTVRFGKNFCWARYDSAPLPGSFTAPTGVPYIYDPNYFQPLSVESETFVAFEAEVLLDAYSIPIYCRTGKGFYVDRKSLRIDVDYDGKGSELSLLFDFAENTITVRDERKGFVLAFGQMSVHDPFESGVPSMEWEYKGIFDTLVRSDWTPTALDERFFPSVKSAASLSTTLFEQLIKERRKPSRILHSYSIKDPRTRSQILSFLDPQAHWG